MNNITMDLIEIGVNVVDWIGLAQDRLQVESFCELGNEPSGSIKCWEAILLIHKSWVLE
jgi:hypothetical protein